ncbi:MAG: RraA family protein [Armatimonadota bacterium]
MTWKWTDDAELFSLLEAHAYSAVIGDILDYLGLYHQFFPSELRPIREDMVLVGRAMTVLEANVFLPEFAENTAFNQPFGLMLDALDNLQPGEIYVASGCSPEYALWGELMSTRAIACGARGAVVNGCSRDTRGTLALNFPVFSRGLHAKDQRPRGKVLDYRCPIEVGEVRLTGGELLFGDLEGVVAIPREVEREVVVRALEKATAEKVVQRHIAEGMTATEAFKRFGIL